MPPLRRPVSIESTEEIASGIRHLRLVPADGQALPAWSPGAHVDVILPSGLIRQFSLCGSPEDLSGYDIAVLREVDGRGGSAEVHTLQAGDQLFIVGPRNRFPLHDAKEYVFIAGGIGITPILPMIEHVNDLGREWRLVYGGRSRTTMAFVDRVGQWGDRATIVPEDESGLLDLQRILAPVPGALVYCCGPAGLLAAVEATCAATWPPDVLNLERFLPEGTSVSTPGDNGTFEVQLGLDGPVVPIPADDSILHTLLDAGVDCLYSCEEGTCGSCETQVLDGTPEHRDSLLSEESRASGCMLICVSRARSQRLVLDLEPPEEILRLRDDGG